MIVDNLNIMTVMTHPPEANAPLIVDPDIYLAGALALSTSSRFPGGIFRPSIVRDASTWRSFLKAQS